MKNRIESWHSSWLVLLPVITVSLAGGVVFAFLGWIYPAAVLIFLSVLGMTARSWGKASLSRMSLKLYPDKKGLFPGEELNIKIEIRNEKVLPVAWTEVFCPISKELCFVPEEIRKPDDWEKAMLKDEGASEELVGEKHFSLLMWNETAVYTSKWTAQKRGVYSTEGWRIRSGDGFGLMRAERRAEEGSVSVFYVYPRLISVSSDIFLKNRWTSDTGAKGVIKDPSVIRSSRDYLPGDPIKSVNWRLTARGLPLSVNVYEDILPRSVHFILDGESFSGHEKHKEELEETLSIIASEIVLLCRKNIRCGLSLSKGEREAAINRFAAEEPFSLLQMMASYYPMKDELNEDGSKIMDQISVFDEGPLLEKIYETGRFYYITYSTTSISKQGLVQKLGSERVTVLSYTEDASYHSFESLCLQRLKGGMQNG